jgi:hypothetical protein
MKIKNIEIKTTSKKFFLVREKDDKDGLRKKQLEAIEEFKRNNVVIKEDKKDYTFQDSEVEIIYYYGFIAFFPTETEEAKLILQVNVDKAMLELIMSLCLENVVEVCDKQTNLFKEMFVKHVNESQNSVNTKINNSFLGKFLGVK